MYLQVRLDNIFFASINGSALAIDLTEAKGDKEGQREWCCDPNGSKIYRGDVSKRVEGESRKQ